ncbi:hypothetical protein C8J57DRAFT_1222416 [Mycena rebaudengoi]|nr:hypothetical protein C8J57DRAFT_1222416 [Mycena rebaudengoi]
MAALWISSRSLSVLVFPSAYTESYVGLTVWPPTANDNINMVEDSSRTTTVWLPNDIASPDRAKYKRMSQIFKWRRISGRLREEYLSRNEEKKMILRNAGNPA